MPLRPRQPALPPAAQTADRLHSAAIHLLRAVRVEDRATGLSGPRLSALSVIVFAGPVTMSALAQAEQVRPPTISKLVRDLEREGLVERTVDPADGRIQRITATIKGKKLLLDGKKRRVERVTAALSALPGADQRLLARAAELIETLARPE